MQATPSDLLSPTHQENCLLRGLFLFNGAELLKHLQPVEFMSERFVTKASSRKKSIQRHFFEKLLP